MESIPAYLGKPTIYLDHNVLDFLVKSDDGSFLVNLKHEYQVVYSDETLKEIRRSVGCEDNFLNLIDKLGAYYLKVFVRYPGFVVTDRATVAEVSIFSAYEDYCNNYGFNDLLKSMGQVLFKTHGGRPDDSIGDIHNEQIAEMAVMFDKAFRDFSDVTSFPAELLDKIKLEAERVQSVFKERLSEVERSMAEHLPSTKSWSGVSELRNTIGLGPKQFNNIEPPNVIEKIWKTIVGAVPELSIYECAEDFLRVGNSFSEETPNHVKVSGLYGLLNMFGYYPDSKMNKENRFVAAESDKVHASMASFCDFFISIDESLVKKARAVYEYLGIHTQVKLLVVNGG